MGDPSRSSSVASRSVAGTLARVGLGALLAASAGAAPEAPSTAPPDTAGENRFDIHEFRVTGNHVLDMRSIERAVYPFLGDGRTIETVKAAADALEKAYKSAGYNAVYVDIPEQEVADAVVRLKVTEGAVEAVHVRGERYFSDRQILAHLPAVEVGKTPNFQALQEQLGALNARTPDRTLTPILKAGAQPGTLDVDVSVKDRLPLHGSIQYDDRHTADTTPNRATASLSYDNLFQRQDSLGVQYQTAPAKPSDAEVLIANYVAHVDSLDSQLQVSYTKTSSNVAALGTLGVLGKGSIYGLHWLTPVVSSATSSQSFNLGADYKDVLTAVSPSTTGAATVEAKVNYINWSAQYSGTWFATGRSLGITAGFNAGLRSVLNGPNEFENSRYNANPNYFYLRVGVTGLETLPWGFGLQQRFSGQWADSPLVNNEQFSLGGVDTVRGYLEAETLGDSGAAGSLELRSPALGKFGGSFFAPLYAFLFVDGGVATVIDPLPAQRANLVLWSGGAGLRLDPSHGFNASLDYALPQRDGVRTLKDHARIDFLLRYGF